MTGISRWSSKARNSGAAMVDGTHGKRKERARVMTGLESERRGSSAFSPCRECGADVAAGLLSCPGCARLLHSVELARLAAAAHDAERASELTSALGTWRRAIALLPPRSSQRAVIQARMESLSAAIDGRGAAPVRTEPMRLGPGNASAGLGKGAPTVERAAASKHRKGAVAGLGAVGLALAKSKVLLTALAANGKLLVLGLLKLPTLLSMLTFVQFRHLWGAGGGGSGGGIGVAVGVVASLYVHEMGHVSALRRYGIEAGAPMFVPGFGAFVRLKQYPTDAHEDARTGLAGPVWGLGAALVAAALGLALHSHFSYCARLSQGALEVASYGATVNLFNLVPFWQLDGARGLRALSRNERVAVAAMGALVALVLRQWMPAIVAAVAFGRAFGSDAHPTGDRRIALLFAGLLVVHGLVATLA